MIEMNGEKNYTVDETAQLLNLSVSTIRRYCRIHKLPADKIGGSFYIGETAIKDYCKKGAGTSA